MAQKWGNFQINCTKNKTPATRSNFPVAATAPNIGGIAPGKAPTKTAQGVNLFNGVYDELIESPGNISVISSPQTCKALQEATLKFGKQPKTELTISCKHSSQKNEAIFIDCSEIYDLNVDEIADKILIEIYDDYERSGFFNLTLTPVEKSFVKYFTNTPIMVP